VSSEQGPGDDERTLLRGRRDILAGATTAAVVIPQAMAYATIAGLPVEYGLYCALVPMLVYAALGTSRPLSVSTTSSISLITGATVATVAAGDRAAIASTLAVLVGAVLLLAGLLRLGFVADFVSDPILAGFKVGMGLVIAGDQLGRILGVPVEGDNVFEEAWSALTELDQASGITVAVGLGCIALLLALHRISPTLPGPLLVVAGGIALVALADPSGLQLISPVPQGLPHPAAPELGFVDDVFPAALGIALIGFTESMAAARAFRRREDPPLDANRELVALGAANVAGGIFRAYPAGGGLSQTAVSDGAGAATRMASVVTAGLVALTLLVLAPIFDDLPDAVLGAIVVVAALGLILSPELRRIRRVRTRDWAFALVALTGILFLGTLKGILVAVAVSLIVLLYQASRPPVRLLEGMPPGLLGIRIEGPLFFANARRMVERVTELVEQIDPKVLLLDLSAMPDMDVTALNAGREFADWLRARGVEPWVAGALPRPLEMLERVGFEARAFPDVPSAVQEYSRRG
jgi:SulP family sulfate permease